MYIRSSKKSMNRRNRNRRVFAEDVVDVVDENIVDDVDVDVNIAPEATELMFEAEDVAELVAEITEEDVSVDADENEVTFTVGDTDYTVIADGDEEILEASRRVPRSKRSVKASRRVPSARRNNRAARRNFR